MGKAKPYRLTGEPLIEQAKRLGIPIDQARGMTHPPGAIANVVGYDEEKIRRWIIEAKRSEREHRLWIVALISAIASAFQGNQTYHPSQTSSAAGASQRSRPYPGFCPSYLCIFLE